jgi:transposase InsO family protein
LDFVLCVKDISGYSERQICRLLELSWGRYQGWKKCRKEGGSLSDRSPGPIRRIDSPLESEIDAVVKFALDHPKDGYRRLTWQMVDDDVAYMSESMVYRILDSRDLLYRWCRPGRRHGSRPEPPTEPHQRWHTDIMYLQLNGVWYFMVSFIDAYSRYIVHHELLTSMTAADISAATERALQRYPGVQPDMVTDRGCQYTSREFKKLVKRFELEHILCQVRHPQSNGIIERYHRATREALDEKSIKDLGQARGVICQWVEEYNNCRLHAGLRYLRPIDYFNGNREKRLEERRTKLTKARKNRIKQNQLEAENPPYEKTLVGSI